MKSSRTSISVIRRYGAALLSTALALWIRLLLTPIVGTKFPFTTIFFAVLFSAWYGGYGPALTAVVLGALFSGIFLMRPAGSWWIAADDQVGILLFLLVGGGISLLGGKMRAARLQSHDAADAAFDQREYLRTTLHSIGDAIIVTDARGRITTLNPVAEELTGWKAVEAEGKPLGQVFVIQNETTGAPLVDPITKVLELGQVVGLANHTVLISRNGLVRPIDDSAAPIRDNRGNIRGVVLVFRDITERRRAEIAQMENNARNAAVLESALDCIITMDHEGRVVEFNQAAEKTFGYSRSQAVGGYVGELIVPPHLREQHYRGLAHYLKTGEGPVLGKRIEIEAMRADGSQFPVEVAITRIQKVGAPTFTAYLRDIGHAKAVERRRNARLSVIQILARTSTIGDAASAILKAIGTNLSWEMGALWAVDRDANVLRCVQVWHEQTQGLEEFANATRHTTFIPGIGLPGRIWNSKGPAWISDVTVDSNFPRASTAVKAGLHGAFGFPLLSEDNVVGVIEFFSKQLREPDDDLMEMMASIGSQIGQVIERRKAEDALREADRRKDEFLAMLAHELRNPLAPIRNALELLNLDADRETTEWAKSVMQRQLQHIVRLVDDLLDVARIMRGKIQLKKELIELSSVIHHALEEAKPDIEAQGHEFTLSLPPEPVWIQGDAVRLSQIVSNLLNNATKYTDKGGSIALAVASVDGHATITVRDSGIGIAPNLLNQIFTPFTQVANALDRSRGGLGIGLALVRNLVELHDGTVTARSEGLGKGSEFVVRLPVISHAGGEERVEWKPSPVAAKKVLVVDDNQSAAQSLGLLLAKLWGHEVTYAYDGSTALETIERWHPDVVLLDIGLPGLSGYEIARRVRQMPEASATLLVALTGYGQEEDRRKSFEAGFDEHLVKPAPIAALQAVFARGRLVQE